MSSNASAQSRTDFAHWCRRSEDSLECEANVRKQVLEFSIFKADRAAHRVWIANEEVQLTALELKLVGSLTAS